MPLVFTVTNTGGQTSGVPSVGVAGANASDFTYTTTCSQALDAMQTCTVTITFTSSAAGDRTATFTVSATPGGAATAIVTGIGGVPISVALSGGGTGTVTSNTGGINCPGTCSQVYAPTPAVTLTAVPTSGHQFMEWTGACMGTAPCAIAVLSSAVAVGARFEVKPIVTLSREPPPGASNHTSLTWEFSSDLPATFECTVNSVTAACTSPYVRSFTNGSIVSFSVVAIAASGARSTTRVGTPITINTATPLLQYELEGSGANSGLLPGFAGALVASTVSGKFGNAVRFTGMPTTGMLISGLGPVFGSTSSEWTISLWYREDAPAVANSHLLDVRATQGWETYHGATNPPTLMTTCAAAGTPGCASFAIPSLGVWHNLVYEYDSVSYSAGAPLAIYLDGVGTPVAQTNTTTPVVLVGPAMTQLRLGNDLGGFRASVFYVDRVRVYNQVFTPASRCTTVIGGSFNAGTCTLP